MVFSILHSRLLSRPLNGGYAALILLLSPWAQAEDYVGSSSYDTVTQASIACNKSAGEWAQNAFGVTAVTCQNTLGRYQLIVTYTGDINELKESFHYDLSGGQIGAVQSDLDDLTLLTVAINDDLTTAESNIINLQTQVDTNAVNIQTNAATNINQQAEIDANSVGRVAHDTRLNAAESSLVTINGELVNLANTDALVASDIGALQIGQGNLNTGIGINASNIGVNAGNIASNELYIANVEAQQETYETTRAASDAQTNTKLDILNATAQGIIDAQNATLATNVTNIQALSGNVGNNGAITAYWGEDISGKLSQTNAEQAFTNTQLGGIAVDQLATRFSIDHTNSLLTLEADRSNLTNTLLNTQNTLISNQTTELIGFKDNNAIINSQQQTKLSEIKDAIEAQSFTISGENISIDNSGVESRLDTLNGNLSTPINAADLTVQTVATYADAITNFKATIDAAPISQMSNGIVSAFANLPPGSCPAPTFDLTAFLGTSLTVTEHCNLKTSIGPILTPIMTLLWSLLGIRMILSA